MHRMAAESLASDSGMTIEDALEDIAFQGRAHDVLDAVEETLGAASGDEWFDWSTGRMRLKIGVTTRAESCTLDAVRRFLEGAGILDRVDFVKVVWSATELAAAQERANEQLKALGHVPWLTARDVSANSIVIEVPDDLTAEQLSTAEAAVRAAGVAVQVRTGAGWVQVTGA